MLTHGQMIRTTSDGRRSSLATRITLSGRCLVGILKNMVTNGRKMTYGLSEEFQRHLPQMVKRGFHQGVLLLLAHIWGGGFELPDFAKMI